jgi:hypothetical protein
VLVRDGSEPSSVRTMSKEYMFSGHAIVFDRLKSTADAARNTKNTSRPKSQKESGSPTSMDITTPVSLRGGGGSKENQQTTMDNFTARVKQARQIARKEALENDG